MKKIIFTLFILSQAFNISAQALSAREQFAKKQQEALAQYRDNEKKEYEAFLAKKNAAYAEFMSKKWEHYKMINGEEAPTKPYPKEPVVVPKDEPNIAPAELPIKNVVKLPTVKPVAPQFKPVPDEVPASPTTPTAPTVKGDFKFTFIGNTITVDLTESNKFKLSGVKEQEVSKRWTKLSEDKVITQLVKDCLYWKQSLKLNDYLYVLMLDTLCDSFFGAAQQNESKLLKTYILAQSGYDAKNARCSAGLVVLLSIEEPIYQKTYLNINNIRYYIIDEPEDSDKQYYTFSQKFADESKSCSVRITEEFIAKRNMTQPRTLASKRYPNIKINTSVDKNMIEIYNNYPRCKWDVYASAPMSSALSNMILPTLQSEIKGKSEQEAANMIINFVQTAFDYKTDDDYFGYERSLFVDETFYYSYSDCEDRSILFANLIKNLMGLDVVLLHYPNHLATAVKFKGNYSGDYMMINNQKYLICDPTYVGANIGSAMPQFKNTQAEVVIL